MSDDEHEASKNDNGNGIAAYKGIALPKGSMPYADEPKLTNFSISSTRHAITTSSLSNVPGNNIKVSRLQCSTLLRVSNLPIYSITGPEIVFIFKIIFKKDPLWKVSVNLIKEKQKLNAVLFPPYILYNII